MAAAAAWAEPGVTDVAKELVVDLTSVAAVCVGVRL